MASLAIADGIVASLDEIDLDEIHTVEFSCGLVWQGRIPSLTWRPQLRTHATYICATLHGSLELRLHRVIMNAKADQIIDHIDHNGLNNVRSNLRVCDPTGNSRNKSKSSSPTTSQYKGVSWHAQAGKWAAHLRINKVKKHLGLFRSETEAAIAYNVAARESFGEFVSLNVV